MSIRKAFCLGALAWLAAAPLSAAIPASETQALNALYNATGGGNWTNKTGWLGAAGTECTWAGVICGNGNTTVVGLGLAGNNLVGTLPAELKNLTNLATLAIGYNNLGTLPASLGSVTSLREVNLDWAGLTGPIPPELGNLVNLRVLSFYFCRGLTGTLPPTLGNLVNLETLLVEGSLTGPIPPALGNLSKLKRLDLNGNSLGDAIPPELARLASLETLDLRGNRLTGGIPKELGGLPSLQRLLLGGNPLGGTIPPTLGGLPAVVELDLGADQLTGGIPKELGGLRSLQKLWLGGNPLGGTIPPELGNLRKAVGIYLQNDQLTGTIPATFGGLPVVELDLSNNALTGPIPKELGNLPAIEFLYLHYNQLSGSIPSELGKVKTLKTLMLQRNALTGSIPVELAGLSSLVTFAVNGNGLTGRIPPFQSGFGSLEDLSLAENQFTGPIPSLTALTRLRSLGLNDNQLTGSIPADLGRLSELRGLGLHNNHLSGPIPAELGSLSHLEGLYANGNDLTGSVPRELGSLTSLKELNLAGNQLSGAIPQELGNLTALAKLFLQDNQLTGGLPPSFGQLTNLETLDLSRNQLGGALPAEIGGLSKLLFLYLSGNQFRSLPAEFGRLTPLRWLLLDGNLIAGSIPRELGSLGDLERLDLQANQLTGSIPRELGALKKLTELRLSFNQLTGPIPPELGGMTALEQLLLQSNQLSGTIPAALGSLKKTFFLDLSKNALSGAIPAEIGGMTSAAYLWMGGNNLSGALPSTLPQLTNLNDGGGLNVSYNALKTDDVTVREFVDKKGNFFGFDRTQTIPPPGVTAPVASTASVTLRWNPIPYYYDAGGYEVLVATGSGSPTVGARTGTKSVSSATVANLQPGTSYTFSVRTVTFPNDNNSNTITSEPGAAVTQSTTPAGSISVALSPSAVQLIPGTNVSMTATIAPTAATPVVVTLTSLNGTVASVPASVTIGAGATTATFAVTGKNFGTSVITAVLPASAGGGSAAADVTVAASACVQPNTPSFLSSTGGNIAVRAGNSLTLTWSASVALDPGGYYQVDFSPAADCKTGLKQYRADKPTLTIPTSTSQAGVLCFVVRAISSQNCPSGDSSRLTVTVQPGPAAFVVSQSAPLSATTSLNVPPPPAKVVFKNIGFTPAALAIRSNLGFASASPTSFPSVPPGGTAEVTLAYDPLSTTSKALLQGGVCGVWSDGGEKTACAAATLTVFEQPLAPGPAARPQISGSSEVHFIAPTGTTPPTQVITVRNPSGRAIRIAPGISPGGAWLTVSGDVLTPIAAGASRDLTLTVDRSRRATADGAPPVSTQLFLANADGPDGDRALVGVFDEEPPATTQGTNRALLTADEYSLILGSSVYAPGSGGTIFVSDGWIRNKAPAAVTADLYYTPSDTDGIGNTQVRRATITLQPYGTYRLSDFVRGLFGTSGSGAVEVRSKGIADLSVRTTVDTLTVKNGATVRYGAEIPTVQSREGVSLTRLGGASLLLPGLRGGTAQGAAAAARPTCPGCSSRTNVILTETSGRFATVALRLFGSDGTLLRETNVTVPPYSKTQVNANNASLFPDGVNIDGATLEVKPVSGAGSVAAFATVIDNASQGYTTRTGRFTPQTLSASARAPLAALTRLAIPTAAHASGQNNSFYTTAVSITNGVASPANLTLKYIVNGQTVASKPVTIPSRATANYDDVIATLFASTEPAGMIFVEGDAAKVVVTSDTSTLLDPAEASRGFSPSTLAAYAPESANALGDPQGGPPSPVISHPALEESTRFRTNLILAEVKGGPATVRVRLFPPGSGGVPLAEKDYTLSAFERIQEGSFMVKMAGPGQYLDYETTVEWVSGTGRVLCVATKIDNDPESKRADVYVLGPTGGLQGTIGF